MVGHRHSPLGIGNITYFFSPFQNNKLSISINHELFSDATPTSPKPQTPNSTTVRTPNKQPLLLSLKVTLEALLSFF